MGETTPPPDDRFPKVFSMTAAAYQPAGARGGFAKQQQEATTEVEAEGRPANEPPPPPSEPQEEGRWNRTGDGVEMATEGPTRSSVESGTAVKTEKTVINAGGHAEQEGGGKTLAEEQQGCRRTTSIYIYGWQVKQTKVC